MTDTTADIDELVTALGMLERLEIIDFNGHGSIRRPDGSILINSGASTRSALSAADIVTIDGDGKLLAGGTPPPMEFHIHTEIYRRRPDVRAVIHGHPETSTLLSATDTKVVPVFAQGCLVANLPVYPSPQSVNSKPVGEEVATALGQARGILLRAHGSILTGETIKQAFVRAVYLEQNCARQYKASLIGKPYIFSDEEIKASESNLNKPNLFDKCWNYYRMKFGF